MIIIIKTNNYPLITTKISHFSKTIDYNNNNDTNDNNTPENTSKITVIKIRAMGGYSYLFVQSPDSARESSKYSRRCGK